MLRRFLAEQRFDVVHVQTPHSPLFAARVVDAARRVQGGAVTVVGTFHILPHSRLSALATRALGVLLRRNLRRFDRLCAVSAPAAAFARQAFRVDARVIPIPLDVDAIASAVRRPRPAPRPGGPRVVVFLGRMVERKGVVELVEALALLPGPLRARLDVRLGGRGPLADEVRRRVEGHGLADMVTMAGFVSEDDKPQFFADADLVALPATGGESFGIVLIEAMAAGAGAVLGGANPGYLSVLGDDPLVSVDPRDTPAFAARLEQLLTDDALRARIGSDQARQVRQYRVQAVGRLIEDFYAGP
jgi:phosphatidylinositol alpha-mannosyltransferase